MRNFFLLASLSLTALLCGCSDNLSSSPASNSSSNGVAAQIQKFADEGWAGVVKGRADFRGSLIFHIESARGNYTVSSGDPVGDPENDHFRAASSTKNYTAAAIMLLAQEGRLNLDDTLGSLIPATQTPYLPATSDFMIPYRNVITIRQLLGHRAGVFDITNNPIPVSARQPYAGQSYVDFVRGQAGNDAHTFTVDEIAGVVSTNQLSDFPPGQKFKYSNGGYALLAKIIEQVSGLRYDQFLQQRFFGPAQFTHTRTVFLGSDQNLDSPFVPGFTYFPAPTGLVNSTKDNMSVHVGEGSIITNPHELAGWYRALFTGGLALKPAGVAQMMEVRPTGESHGFYGLGTTFTPGLGFGHDGAHVGYLTTSRYDPTTGTLVVIYASNLDATDFLGEAFTLLRMAGQAKGLLEGRNIDLSATIGEAIPGQL